MIYNNIGKLIDKEYKEPHELPIVICLCTYYNNYMYLFVTCLFNTHTHPSIILLIHDTVNIFMNVPKVY